MGGPGAFEEVIQVGGAGTMVGGFCKLCKGDDSVWHTVVGVVGIWGWQIKRGNAVANKTGPGFDCSIAVTGIAPDELL